MPAEERQLPTTVNPMCEVFPKGIIKELSFCHKLKFSKVRKNIVFLRYLNNLMIFGIVHAILDIFLGEKLDFSEIKLGNKITYKDIEMY